MSVRVTRIEKDTSFEVIYGYGNFITDEYTPTLRLESELSDLRVGYANPATSSQGEIPRTGHHNRKRHLFRGVLFW